MRTNSYDGKWKGEVVFYDPLSIPQGAEWEYALARNAKALKDGGQAMASVEALLPGVLACVAEWRLKGFPEKVTVDNFPSKPKKDLLNLMEWLIKAITDIYKEDDDPNE